jgi:acetoacetyl-CoA synthetase
MSFNPETGGSVLNPSGIRFGSGEIYAIIKGPPSISRSPKTFGVRRRRPGDTDESVFLFVRMAAGHAFTDDVVSRLRRAISQGLTPRHVPRFIVEVDEVPVTIASWQLPSS